MNFKSLAVGSVLALGSIFGPVGAADARTPWIFVGNNTYGQSTYVANISTGSDGLKYYWHNGYRTGDTRRAMNCRTGEEWSYYKQTDTWSSLGYYKPGTMGEATYEAVCLGYRPQI